MTCQLDLDRKDQEYDDENQEILTKIYIHKYLVYQIRNSFLLFYFYILYIKCPFTLFMLL